MRTHNIPPCYRKSKRSLLFLLTWHCYQPSLARTTPVSTNFHGPKGVRAIEVRLYRGITLINSFAKLLSLVIRKRVNSWSEIGAVVEWLEQLGYGAESRRIA